MAKDRLDGHTMDMIGGKPGRPLIHPEWGPMGDKERQQRCRAGRKSVQIYLSEKEKARLIKYCKRHDISRHKLITNVIRSLRLTQPEFLE